MANKNIQELDLNNTFFEKDKTDEDKPTKREEMLNKTIREVFSTDNIEVRTDLNVNQINALSKGLLFADHFNSDILRKLCKNIMSLSLSKDRKSRGEFVDLTKNNLNRQDELLGGGGGLSARLWGQ